MVKLIGASLGLLLVMLFIFVNFNQRVDLNLIFTQLSNFPLALACLLFLVIGLVVSIPFFLADRINIIRRHRQEHRKLTTYLDATRKELKELEKRLQKQEDIKSKELGR